MADRRRTLVIVSALLLGALAGWLIAGNDLTTLREILDPDAHALDTMTDEQLARLFLPPIVGGLVAAWAANRWIENRPR
jgi:hypothetical protein